MGLISNGTTIFDNGAMASGFGGSMVLVSSATASSSASIEFTLGDYKEYKFFFVNMHPATNDVTFQMNFSTDNGSNYNVTKTTTTFVAYHRLNDTDASLSYYASSDLAQSTSNQILSTYGINNGNDNSLSGYLSVFNPSSSVFVKHFIARTSTENYGGASDYSVDSSIAGYANTTSALTNIKFQMSSGNIDDGKILLFGLN